MLHATLLARRDTAGWGGALLRGPSGAGKSDLALRALNLGFRLVADDRVVAWRSGGSVFGRAPAPLRGLLEVRGLGVGLQPSLPFAEVSLVVDLRGGSERTPEPRQAEVAGLRLPLLDLDPFGESAPARLASALATARAARRLRQAASL